jgi:AraC-like DNA-binding protein
MRKRPEAMRDPPVLGPAVAAIASRTQGCDVILAVPEAAFALPGDLQVFRVLRTPVQLILPNRRLVTLEPGQHLVAGTGHAAGVIWQSAARALCITVRRGLLGSLKAADRRMLRRLRAEVVLRDPLLEHLSGAVLADARQGFPHGAGFIDGLVMAIAAHLGRALGRQEPATLSSTDLAGTCRAVEDRLHEPLLAERLAQDFGWTAERFAHAFREATDQDFATYLVQRRLARATALLRASRQSQTAIALACGFRGRPQMAAAFRRHRGQTPREFRIAEQARTGE